MLVNEGLRAANFCGLMAPLSEQIWCPVSTLGAQACAPDCSAQYVSHRQVRALIRFGVQ
ncbi:hypothetical protein NOVOSPHI9U_800012 [Novosphingobium sp. 9U]|nr:hypothetical protein NOVOSPHI9U_800012 [Novosphingobium sp. 9U]